MSGLAARKCVRVKKGSPPLAPDAAERLRAEVPGWAIRDGKRLEREFKFPDFRTALAFVDRAGAVADAEEALRLKPDDPTALLNRASALAWLGDFEGALAGYSRVLELDPGLLVARLNRANVLYQQGSFPESETEYGLAIQGDPDYAVAYLGRANARVAMERWGDAASDFDEAIRTLQNIASLPSATPRHRQNLALVLGLAGRDDDAASLLRRDMDEATVSRAIAYYGRLRQIGDSGARAAAIGSVGGTFAGPQNATRT